MQKNSEFNSTPCHRLSLYNVKLHENYYSVVVNNLSQFLLSISKVCPKLKTILSTLNSQLVSIQPYTQ